ncbi:MAG: permease [Planctomycetia bacterium]|jgi:uncharacterized membrane protein YraQ (UPF0718 family)
MSWKEEWKKLAAMVLVFLVCFYLPIDWPRFSDAVFASLKLVKWYAQEHVLLCLVPAFFIAGAVGVFVSRESVMKYLGANAPKPIAYAVASVSGTILAVCSCTILPLFSGIYRMGAGLGPACTFLYSGPAINILAIVLTARILGPQLGIARAIGAVIFSIVIGLGMHFLFLREEQEKVAAAAQMPESEGGRPLYQTILYFAAMVGILVFANWGKPAEDTTGGLWWLIFSNKWAITAGFAVVLGMILIVWYGLGWIRVGLIAAAVAAAAIMSPHIPNIDPKFVPMVPFVVGFVGLSVITSTRDDESGEWFSQSWFFAKQILPLLFIGVVIAGLLLGLPKALGGDQGLIPQEWVAKMVGGNSWFANFFASVAGAFMYFATLTEVPILQGLMENGMGNGPALALLLAGPALSLPNMLVINSVIGPKKTVAFVSLVVIMATISGKIYGLFFM